MSKTKIMVLGGSAYTRSRIAEAIAEMLIDNHIPRETEVEGIDGAANRAGYEKIEVELVEPAGYPGIEIER